jgi:hypothetical protein
VASGIQEDLNIHHLLLSLRVIFCNYGVAFQELLVIQKINSGFPITVHALLIPDSPHHRSPQLDLRNALVSAQEKNKI